MTLLLLAVDPACCSLDLAAVLVQSVVDFGRDAVAVIGFLLCMRRVHGWGRGAVCADETGWLLSLAGRALQRADAYLLSEHVGDFSLAQLVHDLVQ